MNGTSFMHLPNMQENADMYVHVNLQRSGDIIPHAIDT